MKNAPSVQTFRLQSDDRANCRPQLTAWDAQSLTTGQVPQINDKIGLFFFLRLALSERYIEREGEFMLKPWPIAPNHEDLFIQHYQWLRGWALRMTDQNQEQAEDLVHDCFVHFTISRPSLPAIEGNLEGYLYTMLRNLHLSQVRRSTRIRETIIALPDHSLLDYDSVEFGLKALEQQAQEQLQLQIQDELRRICEYACMRKETSKAGSVLLLRFFHGYYPMEIARIIKSPRGAVDELLRAARAEARVYLANPTSLGFVSHSQLSVISHDATKRNAEDFLAELSHSIWRPQKSDECLSVARIQVLYQPSGMESIDNASLAHIVSCERCLDDNRSCRSGAYLIVSW